MGSTVVEPLITRLPAKTPFAEKQRAVAITNIKKLLNFISFPPLHVQIRMIINLVSPEIVRFLLGFC